MRGNGQLRWTISSLDIVWILLLLQCHDCSAASNSNDEYSIIGGGASSLGDAFPLLSLSFRSLRPRVALHYAAVGSGKGVEGVLQGDLSWGAVDDIQDPAFERGLLKAYPFMASPYCMIYHLPELKELRLNLSAQNVADIYLGLILFWDDARLCASNLPSIIPVIRSEGSGTTAVWSAAISDSVPTWKEARGSFFTWNASWIGTNWMVGGASIDVASLVRTVSDSIAYVSYSYAAAFGLPFASIGQPSEPPIPVLSNAWPLQAVIFFMFNPRISNCEALVHAFEFIFWSMTSDLGRATVAQAGFRPLEQSEVDEIVMNISQSVLCTTTAELIIQPEFENLSRGLTTTLQVLGALSAAASTCVFAFLMWRLWTRISVGEVLFLSCSHGATLCLALVSFGWAVYPPTDAVCKLVPWLALFPLALLLATICGRLLQVFRIWTRPSSSTQNSLLLSFVVGAGSCLCLFLVILATWTAVNPLESIDVAQDPVGFVFSRQCALSGSPFWLPFSWTVIVFLCVAGVVILLVVWNINPVLGESRWLFITLYTTLLGVATIGLLLLQSIAYSTLSMCFGFFLVFLSLWWIPLYGTKLYHSKKRAAKAPSGGGGGATLSPNNVSGSLTASRIIINSESGGPISVEPASPETDGRLPYLEYPPRLPDERRDSLTSLVTYIQSNIDSLEEVSL